MKRITLALILASLLASLTSCGGEPTPSADNDTSTGGDTTAAQPDTDYARENTPDTLPELDFGGASVRIVYRGDDTTRSVETVGEETGDVVSDAIFYRNRKVEERLNVTLDFIAGDPDHEKYMSAIRTVLMAGDDAYDIIDAIQWRAIPQANEGLYYNLADAPYIDYSQPWWSNEYMDEISPSSDVRYLLSGDISVWQLRHMSCMYFNKRMYEDSFGSPDELYQTVLDGRWTYELLTKYVKEIYQDLNSDGLVNEGDRLGIGSTPVSQTDHFVYTAGISFTGRDKDGYPVLNTDQERNVSIIETLYRLYYETPGTIIYKSAAAMDNELLKLFTDGNMLFYPNRFYTTDLLRDMSDPYGIIPYPKLDESQENYYALVHDSTTLYGIPITVGDIGMPCAVLEAMCAENYRTVTPAYYEVALKVKYTQDDVSAQIIDMIHENVRTDFVYANNYSFTSSVKLGTIARSLMGMDGNPSRDYMSAYDSIKTQIASELEAIIETAKEIEG